MDRAATVIAGIAMLCAVVYAGAAHAATPEAADALYRNGRIYTVDSHDSVQQTLGVRGGRIVYVGSDAGARAFMGPATKVHDLRGRMLMPGLVDGHMHPLSGGRSLVQCDLKYERLTLAQLQARVQGCLDASRAREPDAWLEVGNWFQEAMVGGTTTSRATLDVLQTKRPIIVRSSFGHTALVNTRALELGRLSAATVDPMGGKIGREASGAPDGILQDAAIQLVAAQIPKPTPAQDIEAAEAALGALQSQGVTTFLDAAADDTTLAAFKGAEQRGKLTARAHFAVLIQPPEGRDAKAAVARARTLATRYDEGALAAHPTLTVHNIKLFMDGVITAPACTGAMLEPYFVDRGTPGAPRWTPGSNRGPEVYFPAPILKPLLLEAAAAGLEPHLHADGDRAVHEALDGIEALRAKFPQERIRAAIAHDEIVSPADFPRFAKVGAIPVLSMQWEKPAPDTVDGAQDYLGPARYKYMEPAAFLAAAGARIAYGSDWPVDPLNEWFALKVGVTRTNVPTIEPRYRGRLSEDRGLSRATVLRAITANAAYELHEEHNTGSLEVGKLADFVILDRDFFSIPAEQIANIRVLATIVGGEVVYDPSGTLH